MRLPIEPGDASVQDIKKKLFKFGWDLQKLEDENMIKIKNCARAD